jgi:hypothetical protein
MSAWASLASAQTSLLTDVGLPDPTPAVDRGIDTKLNAPSFSLALNAKESSRHFSVAIPNGTDKPIKVFGVQTSAGLYVTDLPKTISPKGKTTIPIFYVDEPGSSGVTDFIKVLTSEGVKTIVINHDRESVIKFDKTALSWNQGDPAAGKTVTLSVLSTSTVPIAVTALGEGNKATLSANGKGSWTITVTPGSTKLATSFPVAVTLSPALPGVSPVIYCDIESRSQ